MPKTEELHKIGHIDYGKPNLAASIAKEYINAYDTIVDVLNITTTNDVPSLSNQQMIDKYNNRMIINSITKYMIKHNLSLEQVYQKILNKTCQLSSSRRKYIVSLFKTTYYET